MATIVLAEDHHIVRQGVRALLETEPDFVIVGEASDGLEAVEVVERLKPDVLIVDLMMPGLNGLEVTRQISHSKVRCRVIILSMYNNEGYVLEALKNGAVGYVLKDSRAAELVQAVRKVLGGSRYLSPPISERAIDMYVVKSQAARLDPYDTLTTREREVLQMAAEGNTATDIAARLKISSRTVESHRANLMRKLGLRTQSDLVRYTLKRGLLPLD